MKRLRRLPFKTTEWFHYNRNPIIPNLSIFVPQTHILIVNPYIMESKFTIYQYSR